MTKGIEVNPAAQVTVSKVTFWHILIQLNSTSFLGFQNSADINDMVSQLRCATWVATPFLNLNH